MKPCSASGRLRIIRLTVINTNSSETHSQSQQDAAAAAAVVATCWIRCVAADLHNLLFHDVTFDSNPVLIKLYFSVFAAVRMCECVCVIGFRVVTWFSDL